MRNYLTALALAATTFAASASGICYAPPPITPPGTTAICLCDSGGFNCRWQVISTRY